MAGAQGHKPMANMSDLWYSIAPLRSRAFIIAAFLSIPLQVCFTFQAAPHKEPSVVVVDIAITIDHLLRDEDTDEDKKITIDDYRVGGTDRGNKQFWFQSAEGKLYEVAGTYYLSNLLQELTLEKQAGRDSASLDFHRIFESPTGRISRLIRELYWDGLLRRIDDKGIARILSDEKTSTVDGRKYVYVPYTDTIAYRYYSNLANGRPEAGITVMRLPATVTPAYVRSLDESHGLLTLSLERLSGGGYAGVPYVVPGGRFNEMYGWDSYFIALGLVNDGKVQLAKGMVDNFVYEINHYGKILNANRTYYLTRSQPPFLTSMAIAVSDALPKNSSTKRWLARVLNAAIKEYRHVWMDRDHLTSCGLSRYFDSGSGPAPEVETGHYDDVYTEFAQKHGIEVKSFVRAYTSGEIKDPELDRYFVNDRAMRESGHDTSYRLVGRCADLVTVDLNSLLFKIESDIALTINREFSGSFTTTDGVVETGAQWERRALHRRELMNQLLWNEQRGMYFDYDYVQRRQTGYVSATTFYPIWAGLASQHQADLLIRNALPLLEMPGGISGSSEESRGPLSENRKPRQWDHPYGWAPHQMLIWAGMQKYGYDSISRRLAYRWLCAMTLNAVNYNGTVTEKLDVVRRSHDVFTEYGNVGSRFAYITREGFGWSNASYQVGLRMMTPELRRNLDSLLPPEWVEIR
jgi:alpha,alpha-trehalase